MLSQQGKINIIAGPMYTGKTNYIVNKLIKLKNNKNNSIFIVNHAFDQNRNYYITKLNKIKNGIELNENNYKSYQNKLLLDFGMKYYRDLNILLNSKDYLSSNIIVILNAHYFDDLYNFVSSQVDITNKLFIVSGLSSGYKRQKVGQILDLIPYSESTKILKGVCYYCNDEGCFTKKIELNPVNNIEDIDFSYATQEYLLVCRKHYLN